MIHSNIDRETETGRITHHYYAFTRLRALSTTPATPTSSQSLSMLLSLHISVGAMVEDQEKRSPAHIGLCTICIMVTAIQFTGVYGLLRSPDGMVWVLSSKNCTRQLLATR